MGEKTISLNERTENPEENNKIQEKKRILFARKRKKEEECPKKRKNHILGEKTDRIGKIVCKKAESGKVWGVKDQPTAFIFLRGRAGGFRGPPWGGLRSLGRRTVREENINGREKKIFAQKEGR